MIAEQFVALIQGYRLLLPPQHAHRPAIIRANDLRHAKIISGNACAVQQLNKTDRCNWKAVSSLRHRLETLLDSRMSGCGVHANGLHKSI